MNNLLRNLRWVSLLACCFFIFKANAQQVSTISGIVTDNQGKPLHGASVLVKGGTAGVTTNIEGTFSIRAAKGDYLVVSYAGFETKEVMVSNDSSLMISLDISANTMEDIVVVGYATQKRADVTGAVSSVSMKDIEGKPVTNVVAALQGTTPGLIIQENSSSPGGRIGIRIRGERTINNNDPLVVIDGIINADIQGVNPSDIENISILKDASSTAIYGSRASNGVVLITTKKGARGRAAINYTMNYGMQSPTILPDIVDSWVYAELRNEALVNSGQAIRFMPEEINKFKTEGPNVKWIDEIYKKQALQQSHNLSVTGGQGKTTYLFSVGYMDQNSMFKGPGYGYKRYNGRLNLESQVSERLKITTNISYIRNNTMEHAYWTDWIIEQATRMPPIYAITDSLGYTLPSGSNSNSLSRLEIGGYRQSLSDDLNASFNGEYKIAGGLLLKGMIGGRLQNNTMHEQRKAIPGTGDQENRLTENFGRSQGIIGNIALDYNKKINDHNIGVLVGYGYEGETYKGFQAYRLDQPDYDIFVGEQSTKTGNVGWANDGTLKSVFSRIKYNYKEKYLVELSARRDWSSKFAKGKRGGTFPSVSAGWKVSEEAFYADIKNVIPFLKLRGSFGYVGNNRIADYSFIPSVTVVQGYTFNNTMVNTSYYNVANTDLQWETTRSTNIGADIGLLNNKLNVTADLFFDRTFDILYALPLPGLYGYGAQFPLQNAATVDNKGWEVSARYNFRTGQVNHTLAANLSDTKNKVIDMKGTENIGGFDINTILREGFPMFSYYAYRWNGFFQNADEVSAGPHLDGITPKPGDLRYVDKNGDGLIKPDDDRFVLGNRFPRYTYGFNYSLVWKNIDFSFFGQGVGMRNVWLRGESVEAFHNNNEGPVFNFHINRWTPTNPNATYPRLTVGSESANNAAKSDFWIDDAAYLRLKNIQVGYSLPTLKSNIIKRMRIYCTAQNAVTFTKMKGGWDPETADGSGRIYPVAKVFAIGLNASF